MAEPHITSKHNPRVKATARLRDRRERQRRERFLIDGARELARAIGAGVALDEVYVCETLCQSDASRALLAQLRQAQSFPVVTVTEEVFEKIAYGERAEGVLGVAQTPHTALSELDVSPDALVAVIEGVEKPGNLGAILRSADASGVSAVIVADGGTDLFNPNAVRASLGTIFTVPVAAASAAETLAWLREHKMRIFAARVDATLDYTDADLRPPAAIVLGSEASGLTAAWHAPDVTPIRLPMLGVADSLNVSATAGVLFYEALRQRSARF